MALPDMIGRVRGLLPASWFGHDVAPVRDALLAGIAAPFSWGYSLYAFVVAQTRLSTSSGVFLDLFSFDFFGRAGPLRRNAESDANYGARIAAELVRPHNTRAAVSQAITDLTGVVPQLIEPWNTGDCAAIGYTFAVGVGAPLGSLSLTDQVFVTVNSTAVTRLGYADWIPGLSLFGYARPPALSGAVSAALQSVANVAGIGTSAGGVGVGALATIPPGASGGVSRAEIGATLQRTLAGGVRAWLSVS